MEVAAISGSAVRVVTTSQRYNDSDKMTSGRRKSRDTKLGLESRLTNKTDQLQMGLTVAYIRRTNAGPDQRSLLYCHTMSTRTSTNSYPQPLVIGTSWHLAKDWYDS